MKYIVYNPYLRPMTQHLSSLLNSLESEKELTEQDISDVCFRFQQAMQALSVVKDDNFTSLREIKSFLASQSETLYVTTYELILMSVHESKKSALEESIKRELQKLLSDDDFIQKVSMLLLTHESTRQMFSQVFAGYTSSIEAWKQDVEKQRLAKFCQFVKALTDKETETFSTESEVEQYIGSLKEPYKNPLEQARKRILGGDHQHEIISELKSALTNLFTNEALYQTLTTTLLDQSAYRHTFQSFMNAVQSDAAIQTAPNEETKAAPTEEDEESENNEEIRQIITDRITTWLIDPADRMFKLENSRVRFLHWNKGKLVYLPQKKRKQERVALKSINTGTREVSDKRGASSTSRLSTYLTALGGKHINGSHLFPNTQHIKTVVGSQKNNEGKAFSFGSTLSGLEQSTVSGKALVAFLQKICEQAGIEFVIGA